MSTTEVSKGVTVTLPLNPEERARLDAMCAHDMRTRPLQLKWLIDQESARRSAAAS